MFWKPVVLPVSGPRLWPRRSQWRVSYPYTAVNTGQMCQIPGSNVAPVSVQPHDYRAAKAAAVAGMATDCPASWIQHPGSLTLTVFKGITGPVLWPRLKKQRGPIGTTPSCSLLRLGLLGSFALLLFHNGGGDLCPRVIHKVLNSS